MKRKSNQIESTSPLIKQEKKIKREQFSHQTILEHDENISVLLYTQRSESDPWKKVEQTRLNPSNERVVSLACHVSDFDDLEPTMEINVRFGIYIKNHSTSSDVAGIIEADGNLINSVFIGKGCSIFVKQIRISSGLVCPLFLKSHELAQDESLVDQQSIPNIGSIKIRIYSLESVRQTTVTPEYIYRKLDDRMKSDTSNLVVSMKGGSLSTQFGAPKQKPSSSAMVKAKKKELVIEFDLKYRNKVGHLLLLVKSEQKQPLQNYTSQHGSSFSVKERPQIIEISDDDN